MKALAIIAIGLACAGCASADQRANADQRASADQRARRNATAMAQMIAEDDAYCKRYVDKGYDECRNKLTEMRAANGIGAQQGGGPRRVTTTKCIPTTTGVTCN
jgi:Flp pilus assembly protein TadD